MKIQNPTKVRKRVIVGGIASIIASIGFIIATGLFYILYRRPIENIVGQHPDLRWFVIAFEFSAFGVAPALCLSLIALSCDVLRYLRSEKRE